MKEFNLEEAINGKAFYLKNGYRGVIKYCVDDILTSEDRTPRFAYIGYVLDNLGFLNLSKVAWDENGITNEPRSYDAVGMVEDMLEQNTEEKMKMKPFNLNAALNGEPVMLRNGKKAYISHKTPDNYVSDNGKEIKFPLHGYIIKAYNIIEVPYMFWNINGRAYKDGVDNASDIVGMWEEPKISIEDLPKPFKPKSCESYYYICGRTIGYMSKYAEVSPFDSLSAQNGQCFRTKEDAQKWIDFMKSMIE